MGRDDLWGQSGHLASFFLDTVQRDSIIDLQDLEVDNNAVEGDDDWVLSDSDSAYVVFLRQGGNALLNLVGNDDYDVTWFNPRTGETTDGGSVAPNGRLDSPPSQQNQNWAVVLTR